MPVGGGCIQVVENFRKYSFTRKRGFDFLA